MSQSPTSPASTPARAGRTVLDMNGYQWTVLLAAWLGWGFDVFDGLLFNYVAPNCIPTLLGLPIGSPEAAKAALHWNGILSSILLLGWATGGILFGKVADRLGRTRTLLLTMLLYALGTALCAAAPNLWALIAFRVIASLGIGGEWAAGAAMVAEVVPEKRRVEAGALLYTSAPAGLFLATFANYQIAGVFLKGAPETSWRYVFLCGLIPAAVAFAVRIFVREPERWKNAASSAPPPRIRELFQPDMIWFTVSGLSMALIALITWWSCNVFIPLVGTGLARATAQLNGLDKAATLALAESWKAIATNMFNLGGLIGTLLTIPAAKLFGRRTMFGIYYLLSGIAVLTTFGLDLAPEVRLRMYFLIGLTVFGVFGSFTFYLPELFPTRLRGTGAGFCYNAGRYIASAGPFLVGTVAAKGPNSLDSALRALFWVGWVPLVGVILLAFRAPGQSHPLIIETKGRELA
jgi:MFS family permease